MFFIMSIIISAISSNLEDVIKQLGSSPLTSYVWLWVACHSVCSLFCLQQVVLLGTGWSNPV